MLDQYKRYFLIFGIFVVLLFWLVFTFSNAWISFAFWEFMEFNVTLSASVALVVGSFGLVFRVFASILGFVVLFFYLKNKTSLAFRFVSLILVFEALHVLFYGFNGLDGLEFGDFVLIVQSSINCIIGAVIVPLPLFVLSKKIWSKKTGEVIKWGFISGFAYILMLWIRFASNWIAVLIQSEVYYSLLPGYGLDYILNYPVNLFGFILTLFGLPLLAIYFLKARKSNAKKMISRFGWTISFLGFYFLILFVIYAFSSRSLIFGASIWSSFFVGHNYDLWMVSLPVFGIPLILLTD